MRCSQDLKECSPPWHLTDEQDAKFHEKHHQEYVSETSTVANIILEEKKLFAWKHLLSGCANRTLPGVKQRFLSQDGQKKLDWSVYELDFKLLLDLKTKSMSDMSKSECVLRARTLASSVRTL